MRTHALQERHAGARKRPRHPRHYHYRCLGGHRFGLRVDIMDTVECENHVSQGILDLSYFIQLLACHQTDLSHKLSSRLAIFISCQPLNQMAQQMGCVLKFV